MWTQPKITPQKNLYSGALLAILKKEISAKQYAKQWAAQIIIQFILSYVVQRLLGRCQRKFFSNIDTLIWSATTLTRDQRIEPLRSTST